MMRILKSIAGGILIPLLLFLLAMAGDTSDVGWLERAAFAPFAAVVWPLFIFSPLFPPPPECPSCVATLPAVVASVVVDFLAYALMTYAALRLYERRNPVVPEVIGLKL